jgi:PilZ domain-containing protein
MADLSQKSFGHRARLNDKAEAELMQAREFVAKRLSAISNAKPVMCPTAAAALRAHRERAPRKTVYRLASLFTSKMDSVRCVVVNLSADGARITMEDTYELPEFVMLRFDQSGVKKKARIAWRQDRDIGLSFIKEERDDETLDGDQA